MDSSEKYLRFRKRVIIAILAVIPLTALLDTLLYRGYWLNKCPQFATVGIVGFYMMQCVVEAVMFITGVLVAYDVRKIVKLRSE